MKVYCSLAALFLLVAFVGNAKELSDTAQIRSHLTVLTKTNQYRTHENVAQLNETAEYIRPVFAQYADRVSVQEYGGPHAGYKIMKISYRTGIKTKAANASCPFS